MRRQLYSMLQAFLAQPPDPRTLDPMSMTLHDVIRLVQSEKQSSTPHLVARCAYQLRQTAKSVFVQQEAANARSAGQVLASSRDKMNKNLFAIHGALIRSR